jgi:predicted secreted hydrolase
MNILVVLSVLACLVQYISGENFIKPTGPVELPTDDAVLEGNLIQWWYWTGFLSDASQRLFGFEICFFLGEPTHPQVVHVALTDVADSSFTFDSVTRVFDKPKVIPNSFNFTAGSANNGNLVTGMGGDGMDTLSAMIGGKDGYKLDLKLKSTKPAAIHYGGKLHKYPRSVGGGYTYYYSRTSMTVEANLTLPNESTPTSVTGQAWFDRQYGNLIRPAVIGGWQWFAISLEDGSEIMLYFQSSKGFFDKEEEREERESELGSITDKNGVTTPILSSEASLEVIGNWTSKNSGCVYPSGWHVTVKSQTWILKPYVEDQELGPREGEQQPWVTPIYWEGANSATGLDGAPMGRAYVELNGFCPRFKK